MTSWRDVQPIVITLAMFAAWYVVFRYIKPPFLVMATAIAALAGGYSVWLLVQGRTSAAITNLIVLAVALLAGGIAKYRGSGRRPHV